MAKKRADENIDVENKSGRTATSGRPSVSDSRQVKENGGSQEGPSTPSVSGLSTIEFNAKVARKAYELFEARGRKEGRDVEDWLEAERLVKEELVQQSQAVA